jgi:hypothetical protein
MIDSKLYIFCGDCDTICSEVVNLPRGSHSQGTTVLKETCVLDNSLGLTVLGCYKAIPSTLLTKYR